MEAFAAAVDGRIEWLDRKIEDQKKEFRQEHRTREQAETQVRADLSAEINGSRR